MHTHTLGSDRVRARKGLEKEIIIEFLDIRSTDTSGLGSKDLHLSLWTQRHLFKDPSEKSCLFLGYKSPGALLSRDLSRIAGHRYPAGARSRKVLFLLFLVFPSVF